MPTFEVTVEGTGIRVAIDDAEAVGFYRLLRVIAEDPVSAGRRAMEIVRADWETGPHSRINRGRTPDLSVDGVEVLPWWHRFTRAPSGYIFFPTNESDDA